MKRKLIRVAFIGLGVGLMAYGFTEGMQWYRLAAVTIGGAFLGARKWI